MFRGKRHGGPMQHGGAITAVSQPTTGFIESGFAFQALSQSCSDELSSDKLGGYAQGLVYRSPSSLRTDLASRSAFPTAGTVLCIGFGHHCHFENPSAIVSSRALQHQAVPPRKYPRAAAMWRYERLLAHSTKDSRWVPFHHRGQFSQPAASS